MYIHMHIMIHISMLLLTKWTRGLTQNTALKTLDLSVVDKILRIVPLWRVVERL